MFRFCFFFGIGKEGNRVEMALQEGGKQSWNVFDEQNMADDRILPKSRVIFLFIKGSDCAIFWF